MSPVSSQHMRRRFLEYFKSKGHSLLSSSSVVPHEDPTLLFTNAGMNQFKDVFLGKSSRDYTRAATSQKCIRVGGKHNDLDNVGHTSRHLTFFEMLGNFSFGDYFKKEAILYAWEVATQIFEFPQEKIWVSVFEKDDEAFALWAEILPVGRIVRLGEKDNFWAMGDTGPCGPCSELLYDRGDKYGSAPSPKEDLSGERYLEFWNLVFMQFNRDSSGKMTPLPKQSIDTGSGLERVVSLQMGVDSVFATDVLRSLIAQTESVCKKIYRESDLATAPAFHVIADHIRSLAFAIADGAQPSNIERGYVLRKILRRAVRYGKTLGIQEPFLAKVLPRLVDIMGDDYRELHDAKDRIAEILTLEEEGFLRTLKRGGNILNVVIEKAHQTPLKQISGEEAFKLKDTYGFPLEEILLIAKDTGLEVNLESYALLEERAKEKSRMSKQVLHQETQESLFHDFASKQGKSVFVGYEQLSTQATIKALVINGNFVNSLSPGQEALVILDRTPFYAEKGGQMGDTGVIKSSHSTFQVTGCHSPYPDVIVHLGRLEGAELSLGESVEAHIEEKHRTFIANNHTATHLLHFALQQVLGPHIRQAGSLVEAGRLRFDFNHHKALSTEEIHAIEDLVNEKIRANTPVSTYELSYEEAQKKAEIKQFFGEKYGSKVRVVDIEYSKELCGGTHTFYTGNIGFFRISKESSIAAGVRRIEALTGRAAEAFARQSEHELHQVAALLKSTPPQIIDKLSALLEEDRELREKSRQFRKEQLKQLAQSLLTKIIPIPAGSLLTAIVEVDPQELSLLAEAILERSQAIVLVLGIATGEKCQLLIRVSHALIQKGIEANTLLKAIAPLAGATGGGKAESAQAGGKNPGGLNDALAKAHSLLSQ